MSYMQDIPVRNRELITLLNAIKDTYKDPDFEKHFHLQCEQDRRNRHWWVGDEYLQQIINEGTDHEGFPDSFLGYEISTHREGHEFFDRDAPPTYRRKMTEHIAQSSLELIQWLGVRHNALTAIYPPGGYISWHNNANAPAYNLIFSWSETGDGYFQYVDPVSKEIVKMQDHEGWQCKAAYFGHYNEPERLFYHSASSDCWRCTVSFIMDTTNLSEEIREDLLEEIASAE